VSGPKAPLPTALDRHEATESFRGRSVDPAYFEDQRSPQGFAPRYSTRVCQKSPSLACDSTALGMSLADVVRQRLYNSAPLTKENKDDHRG
jgi:hypothetical protein